MNTTQSQRTRGPLGGTPLFPGDDSAALLDGVRERVQAARAAAAAGVATPAGWLRAGLAAFAEWRERIRGRRQLQKLDARLLADVGLNRVDAWREGRKNFWQP
jgi:uncharacterized protein YjiS (DUF1127 family)